MRKKQKSSIIALMCVGLASLSLSITSLAIAAETQQPKASDILVEDLFSSSTATITQNAHLPAYMSKVHWKGTEYDAAELTAVRIETDGGSATAKVNYNKVINLSDYNENNMLFDFIVAPAKGADYNANATTVTVADYEFRYLYVTLTDVYDKDNAVVLEFERRQDFFYWSSMRVKTPTQKAAGWVESSKALRAEPYGTPLTSAFTGCPSTKNGQHSVISTYFDYPEKTIYASPDQFFTGARSLVRDLDDSYYCMAGDTPWKGFTTGEVNLSIEFARINDSTNAAIYVFGINGQDLTGESIVDTTAPIVKPMDENLSNGVPEGEVGIEYRIFDAVAYDGMDGNIPSSDIRIKVLAPDGKELPITNGAFTPQTAGQYVIVWTTEDRAGNVGEYELPVTVRGKLNNLEIFVNGNHLAESYQVGDTFEISGDVEVQGGAGAYKTSIFIVNEATGQETQVKAGPYSFERKGYYTVVYRAEDYLGKTVSEKFFLRIEPRTTPLVIMPSMPAAMSVNSEFVFPTFTAIDYNSQEGNPIDAKKYYEVSTDGWVTSTRYEVGDTFVPTKTGMVSYKVYAVNIANTSQIYESEAGSFRVVSANNIGEFFNDGQNKVKADYSQNSQNPLYATTKNASLDFINALSAETFYFTFEIPKTHAGFDKFTVTLTDSIIKEKSAKISLVKRSDGNVNVLLNGKLSAEMKRSFVDETHEIYLINGNVYTDSTLLGNLENDGGKYFTSGLVYLNVAMEEVESLSGFTLSRVNNQRYVGLYQEGHYDITAPVIVPGGDISLVRYVGQKIVIPSAKAYDVLDSRTEISVKVSKGDKIVYSEEGKVSGVVLDANEPAKYTLVYQAKDSSGNVSSLSYVIQIYHQIKPALTVNGKIPSKANIGDVISIPEATARDYMGNSLTVHAFVIDTNGAMEKAGDKFTVTRKGRYTVRYYCIDEYGCYTIRDYQMEV